MDSTRWQQLSIFDQLGNIGAEIGRSITWQNNRSFGDPHVSFNRGIDYLTLTIDDPKNTGPRRRELCRLREALNDWHLGSQLYHTTNADWETYFNHYAEYANKKRHS